jgi:hypothetical protein
MIVSINGKTEEFSQEEIAALDTFNDEPRDFKLMESFSDAAERFARRHKIPVARAVSFLAYISLKHES